MKLFHKILIPIPILLITLSCGLPAFTQDSESEALPEEASESPVENEILPEEEQNPPAEQEKNDPQPVEVISGELVSPQDFEYLGAFRLPGDEDRPLTFLYGGNAMTVNPAGDPSGADDGFDGSLFISAHDRMPYGDLPDGNQLAEVNIPAPVISKNLEDLPVAEFLQNFENVFKNNFKSFDEIPRQSLLYLDHPLTGPKIHVTFGEHFQEDLSTATHAWINPDLKNPEFQGEWFLGDQSLYDVNGYMLEIPDEWAEQYVHGYKLASGRYRDGGWSGMGPNLFAYTPWNPDGSAPDSGTHLDEIVLLQYMRSSDTENIENNLKDYQHPDEWEGSAWLQSLSGKSAVLFGGTKGTGDHFWYGFLDADDPTIPCLEAEMIGQFHMCLNADGNPCEEALMKGCDNQLTYRGWWSSQFNAQFILYDPADLARVAAGEMESWEPQPYASINFDERLFLNPGEIDLETLGSGEQRRFRIGEIAFDPLSSRLYVLELFADEAKPVVHVWRID
ncbi:MAG: hypothetical protein JEZ06_11090 [Anaerolineaceae bacterium]|nr:hypothetical protein [Anaerolineaceae bacterium]